MDSDKVLKHDLNIAVIVAEMENAEVVEDFEGEHRKSLYIGTVFNLTPSGKYYLPFACSNVDPCPVCEGTGKVPNLHYLPRLHSRASEIVDSMMIPLKESGGYHLCSESFRNRLDSLRAVTDRTQPELCCSRCDGLGSAEACDDEVWRETLESDLSEHGMWLESGEGDPCDLFVCMPVEEKEDEESEVGEACCGS